MAELITKEELEDAYELLRVTSEKYRQVNPEAIRIYLDVNGVVIPDLESAEEYENFSGVKMAVPTIKQNYGWDPDEPLTEKTAIWFNEEVIHRLATLSRDPRVVVVWLTDWRISAPLSLDKAMGIESIGYLDWQRKFTDYNQSFKGVAIREDQKSSPSKFIWIDDRANRLSPYAPAYFSTEIRGGASNWIIDDEDDMVDATLEIVDYEGSVFRLDIPRENYLNVTTRNTDGLTMKELDLIEEWIDENYAK